MASRSPRGWNRSRSTGKGYGSRSSGQSASRWGLINTKFSDGEWTVTLCGFSAPIRLCCEKLKSSFGDPPYSYFVCTLFLWSPPSGARTYHVTQGWPIKAADLMRDSDWLRDVRWVGLVNQEQGDRYSALLIELGRNWTYYSFCSRTCLDVVTM